VLYSSLQSRTLARVSARVAGPPRRLFLLLALAATPLPLFAQSTLGGDGFQFKPPAVTLTLRGGYDRPFAGGDIYSFATDKLTLSKSAFAAVNAQLDLGINLSPRVQIVLGAGTARSDKPSEFRKYIDTDNKPIEQSTRLRRIPLTVGARYALRPTGEQIGRFAWIPSRLVPWAGAGVGSMNYSFSQVGDFVDFKTLNVFPQTLESSGWAPMAYANVGGDLGITTHLLLTGDLRYTFARGKLDGGFVGFNNIDLSGAAATMGFTLRY
jgi:hypothetical protein